MSALKVRKRKVAHVKVSYDSGSEGDVESDEEELIRNSQKKSLGANIQTLQTKRHIDVGDKEDLSDGGGGEEDGDDDGGDGDEIRPAGWADAMASILRKEAPVEGSAVLAKSKDYAKAKEEEKKELLERLKEKQSKKKWENMAKVIPKATEKDYERSLQRIATKGVVQLFNAVKKQQKTREEKLKEVGGSQRKRAKVEASLTKENFLDMLKGTPAPSRLEADPVTRTGVSSAKKSSSEQPSWGVLRDDFMLGAGMKDWDKEDEESNESDDDMRNSEDADSGLSSDSD